MANSKKETVKVTRAQLEAIMYETKLIAGMAVFSKVKQITKPKLTVKSRADKTIKNTFGEIEKISEVSVIFNTEYIKRVTNTLKRENKDVSEYKQGANNMIIEFGENNLIIGDFKGKTVIQYEPNQNNKPKVTFLENGKEIEKSKLIDFLPLENKAQNQGTDKEILVRKVYFENVYEISWQGEIYEVID